jgi:hypothetical protein
MTTTIPKSDVSLYQRGLHAGQLVRWAEWAQSDASSDPPRRRPRLSVRLRWMTGCTRFVHRFDNLLSGEAAQLLNRFRKAWHLFVESRRTHKDAGSIASELIDLSSKVRDEVQRSYALDGQKEAATWFRLGLVAASVENRSGSRSIMDVTLDWPNRQELLDLLSTLGLDEDAIIPRGGIHAERFLKHAKSVPPLFWGWLILEYGAEQLSQGRALPAVEDESEPKPGDTPKRNSQQRQYPPFTHVAPHGFPYGPIDGTKKRLGEICGHVWEKEKRSRVLEHLGNEIVVQHDHGQSYRIWFATRNRYADANGWKSNNPIPPRKKRKRPHTEEPPL